MIINLK